MKRQVITIQEDMVIYAPHHGEVYRKVCQAEQVKNEYPMIIVMNGTMPRDAS